MITFDEQSLDEVICITNKIDNPFGIRSGQDLDDEHGTRGLVLPPDTDNDSEGDGIPEEIEVNEEEYSPETGSLREGTFSLVTAAHFDQENAESAIGELMQQDVSLQPSRFQRDPTEYGSSHLEATDNVTSQLQLHAMPMLKKQSDAPNQKQKREALNEISILRNRQGISEKDVISAVQKCSLHAAVESILLSPESSLYQRSGEMEFAQIQGGLGLLRDQVNTLLTQLEAPKSGPDYVKIIKTLMESIESGISLFRTVQKDRYDQLQVDEKYLHHDLTMFTERMQSWDKPQQNVFHEQTGAQANIERSLRSLRLTSSNGLLPEVVEFDAYLTKHGGHYGGWDDLSHQAYLKIRQLYHGRDEKLLQALIDQLPTIDSEEIKAHEVWYQGYVERLEAKKLAIQQWKLKKQIHQSTLKSVEKEVLTEDPVKKKLEAKRLEAEKERLRLQKEQLEVWKEQKEIKRLEEEKRKHREREKQKERERKKKEEMIKVREEVTARIERERQLAEHLAQQQHQKEVTSRSGQQAKNAVPQKTFQERQEINKAILEKRKQLMSRKEKTELEKAKRLEKLRSSVQIHVEKDPSRLFQTTAGFRQKVLSNEEQQPGRDFQVNVIPRRSIPSWRAGI